MIYKKTSIDGRFRLEMFSEIDENNVPHVYRRNNNWIRFVDLDPAQGVATVSLGDATYVFDQNREVVFDTTDYIRTLNNGNNATAYVFKKNGQISAMSFNYIINEGADPYIIAQTFPKDNYLCNIEEYQRLGYHLPNVIYDTPAFSGRTIVISDIDGSIGNTDGGDVLGEFVIQKNATIVGGADYPTFVPIKPLLGMAALVRWDALAGWNAEQSFQTSQPHKQAVWEVVSQKTTTAAEEYTTHGNGYYCHKTPSLSLTLKISGLDAYSYQYYADIVAANDVRLILSPDDDILGDEARVEVQTKDIKTQMACDGQWFDLLIDVAYKGF